MNGLRNLVDKIKPTFEKGGKLGFLHSTFDAFETFLFVPDTVTKKGAHVRDCVDLKRVMIMVVLALVPAMLFGIWNTGYQHSEAFGLGWGFWNIVLYGLVKVLPMDLYPVYLLKACLANDIDKMEKFGIYEVLEEDLALCEYVCPSKIDIQQIITDGISLMLKEMC